MILALVIAFGDKCRKENKQTNIIFTEIYLNVEIYPETLICMCDFGVSIQQDRWSNSSN